MGVDLVTWRTRIAAFPNLGPERRRKREEGPSGLIEEGQWWRLQIVLGFAILAVGLCIFQTAPLCPFIVGQPSDPTQPSPAQPNPTQQTVPNDGTATNELVFHAAPHLLLLRAGDVEVNPGPGDEKIIWDDDKIIGRSGPSEWVFTQKQENEALLKKQSEEEAAKAQQKAEEEARDQLKKEEDERRALKREEEKAAWIQHLKDEADRQALEAEEKRKEAEEDARMQAKEEKKSEEETIWTPTESTKDPTPMTPEKASLKPLQVESPQPSSSYNPSLPEDPMDPEVSIDDMY